MTPDSELFFHRFTTVGNEIVAFVSTSNCNQFRISREQMQGRVAVLSAKGADCRFSKQLLDAWPLDRYLVYDETQVKRDKIPPLKTVKVDPELRRVWGLGKTDNSASALADWMAVMDAERVEREEKAARDAIPEYPGVWPPPLLGFPRG